MSNAIFLVLIIVAIVRPSEPQVNAKISEVVIADSSQTIPNSNSNFMNWTIMTVTAYNVGDPNQCWGDPCLAANGSNICELLAVGGKFVAANFGDFGDWLEIKNANHKIVGRYQIVDRTNSRYNYRVDIAFPLQAKQEAKQFGRQNLYVRLLSQSEIDQLAVVNN